MFSFSQRHLKNLEKDSFEYNVELQFIREKRKKLKVIKNTLIMI